MQQVIATNLEDSYAYCERLARQQARHFYPAFRILPAPKRRAMCALYAFLRLADDLTDDANVGADKREGLAAWRQSFTAALEGQYAHSVHPALHHALTAYKVPAVYLFDVLDGVAMDLEITSYATFTDLYTYCYRVASAVGLACIHIWGFRDQRALVHAEQAGIAFQLTNILRDLPEDAARGRVYLPGEDLSQFGYPREELIQHTYDERFCNLMRFEVTRARDYYDGSAPLASLLHAEGRVVFQVMTRTYRSLLELIERRRYDVYSRRVSLSPWRKMRLVMQAVPARLGWS
jgi:phytoene synthase